MRDLGIRLEHRPGALAEMGEALGTAGVSVEGGGGFVVDGKATMHFLFEDGAKARAALEAAGIEVLEDREVLVQRLDQGTPGQLGRIARAMSDAGVNIEVLYSDHENQLVLGVDQLARGRQVSEAWTRQRQAKRKGREHSYRTTVSWTGNTGTGTASYRGYKRDHEIAAEGKPAIPGSSDPAFLGDRFGRSDDAARNKTWPAFVLAPEDKDDVALGDVLPAVHCLLSGERKCSRPRIDNCRLDGKRHFCSALTSSRYSSQNAETFFRPELPRTSKSSAKVSG